MKQTEPFLKMTMLMKISEIYQEERRLRKDFGVRHSKSLVIHSITNVNAVLYKFFDKKAGDTIRVGPKIISED